MKRTVLLKSVCLQEILCMPLWALFATLHRWESDNGFTLWSLALLVSNIQVSCFFLWSQCHGELQMVFVAGKDPPKNS